ncbi:MAG: potassium-transporting ATPase subunit KdpA, partial [Woeseiaceae bacterium]
MQALTLIALTVGVPAIAAWPLGRYMTWAMDPGQPSGRLVDSLTRVFQFVGGRMTHAPQSWKQYVASMLAFNAILFAVAFVIMAAQQHLPLNPDGKGAIEASLIFNTAASFTSNTNLQHYSGEVTMSYFSQLGA